MNRLRLTSAILSTTALVLLGVAQATPWGTFHYHSGQSNYNYYGISGSIPAQDVTVHANTWDHTAQANGGSQTTSWYSKDRRDNDGRTLFLTAIPFALAGLVAALAAAVLTVFRPGALGPGLAFVGAALATTATVLFAVGTHQFFGGTNFAWGPSFYLGIVACAALLAAGVSALAVPRLRENGVPAGLE